MKIICYINKAEDNVVHKGSYLRKIDTINGTIRSEVNILNPSITIESNSLPQFNYVYIEEFKRYYFVENIDIISNKLYVINLRIDVLFRHEPYIYKLKGLCKRNEYMYNNYIVDDKVIFKSDKTFEEHEIDNRLFGSRLDHSFAIVGYNLEYWEK